MTIAIDFDGTIVEHAYPKIGRDIPFAVETIKRLQETGEHRLILWTVREGSLLDEAVEYCTKKGLKFYAINKNYPEEEEGSYSSRKLAADLFIDDRNLGGIPDWGVIYSMIKSNSLYNFDELSEFNQGKNQKKKNFFIRLGESIDKAKKTY